MAMIVSIEPGYSPHSSPIIEICSHCDRPLCPHCWNHSTVIDEATGYWECSNSDCELHFQYFDAGRA
jgi:hypothetical protein